MLAFFLYSNIFLLPKPDVATKIFHQNYDKFFNIHNDNMIFQTNNIALNIECQIFCLKKLYTGKMGNEGSI